MSAYTLYTSEHSRLAAHSPGTAGYRTIVAANRDVRPDCLHCNPPLCSARKTSMWKTVLMVLTAIASVVISAFTAVRIVLEPSREHRVPVEQLAPHTSVLAGLATREILPLHNFSQRAFAQQGFSGGFGDNMMLWVLLCGIGIAMLVGLSLGWVLQRRRNVLEQRDLARRGRDERGVIRRAFEGKHEV